MIYNNHIETHFNGVLWLARDLSFSNQYLGSGKTESQAIQEMQNTIDKLLIKKVNK